MTDAHFADLRPRAYASLDERARTGLDAASQLLWETAAQVDGAESVPQANFDALAVAGLYGAAAPVEAGGLGLGTDQLGAVLEELAGSCAATALVWVQHLRFVRAMAGPGAPAAMRSRWLEAATTGRTRAGVVLTGLMPGPVRLRAEPGAHGWALSGQAPWVSGWGMVDILLVVASGPGGEIVSVVVPARDQDGLAVSPTALAALNATGTVRLGFDRIVVPADMVVSVEKGPPDVGAAEDLRLNGFFALGVARRCCSLMDAPSLEDRLRSCRKALISAADPGEAAVARAQASGLAVRCAQALAVHRGSASALRGDVAERLGREAALFLVFATRPTIRAALLDALEAGPRTSVL